MGVVLGLRGAVVGLFEAALETVPAVGEAQLQRPHVDAQKPFGLAVLFVSIKAAEHAPKPFWSSRTTAIGHSSRVAKCFQ